MSRAGLFRKTSVWSVIGLLCGFFNVYAQNQKSLVIVRDGKPAASIVLARKPRSGAVLAAKELQNHIEKMTGARLRIINETKPVKGAKIFVGESDATKKVGLENKSFKSEEYCVKTVGGNLFILGRDQDIYNKSTYGKNGVYADFKWYHDMGTLWGAYDFLENECGVRWYFPGKLGTITPKTKTLTVSQVARKRRPWARHRFVCPDPFPEKLYWYRGLEPVKGRDMADWHTVNLWWLRSRLRKEPVSFSHAYHHLLKKWKKESPEKIGKGRKTNDIRHLQPAYHKPEVVDEVADMVIEHFNKPLKDRWSEKLHVFGPEMVGISPMDNNKWCKSPEARKYFEGKRPKVFWNGYASRYVWDFVNAVARKVAKKHPDKFVGCFAYAEYQEPYDGMTIEPNVAVQYCRPITQYWQPVIMLNCERALDKWLKLKPARLYLYDYFCFPEFRAQNLFPGWFPHLVASDMKRMKRIGLRGAYNNLVRLIPAGRRVKDGVRIPRFWPSPMLDFVNLYIWFKYLDDQSQDVDDLLDEMCEKLYGPAGPYIRKFINKMESTASCWPNYQRKVDNYSQIDGEDSWRFLCPPEKLAEFGKLIEAAKTAAKTPEQKARVKLFDDGVFQMMKNCSNAWRKKNPVLTADNSLPLPVYWNFMLDPEKKGEAAKWFAADLDDRKWFGISTHTTMEKQKHYKYRYVWYRTKIEIPAKWKGRKVELMLGAVDESCKVWVNGKPAGKFTYNKILNPNSWKEAQFFDITQFVKFGEKNQITVMVENQRGQGGLWKPSYLIALKPKKVDNGHFYK